MHGLHYQEFLAKTGRLTNTATHTYQGNIMAVLQSQFPPHITVALVTPADLKDGESVNIIV